MRITALAGSALRRLSRSFSSLLELPRLTLSVSPDAGRSHFLFRGPGWTGTPTLTLRATAEFVDGIERAPTVVRYAVNGDPIGEAPLPDFALAWEVSHLHPSVRRALTETYTLSAEAVDPYLARSMRSTLREKSR